MEDQTENNRTTPELYKKCPICKHSTNGIEDYKSLIEGKDKILKSCISCRTEKYKTYKENNPDKFKKNKERTIDYMKEYAEWKRCPQCNKQTEGEEDYQNIRSGNTVKNCRHCRKKVLTAVKQLNSTLPKPITQRDKIELLYEILSQCDDTLISKLKDTKLSYKTIIEDLNDN